MKLNEIADRYNVLAKQLDVPEVKRFPDKATGLKRLAALEKQVVVVVKESRSTLRDLIKASLSQESGLTVEEVQDIFLTWYAERNKSVPEKRLRVRALEAIRLIAKEENTQVEKLENGKVRVACAV